MKKKISIILVLVAAVATLHAQIPTIDAASLQQLYSQYQTMQQQLGTARNILNTSTSILNQEQSIYQNALGNVSQIPSGVTSWLNSFGQMQRSANTNGDWFQLSSTNPLVPVASFNNNVGYWANQIGGGYGTANLQTCWQTSISNVNAGTANSTESKLAMAGYNSHLVDNAPHFPSLWQQHCEPVLKHRRQFGDKRRGQRHAHSASGGAKCAHLSTDRIVGQDEERHQ